MSPLHEDWVLVSFKVIYFALPTKRGTLLIGLYSSAAEHRLKLYLKEVRIDAGETLQPSHWPFRAPPWPTLGWSSPATAEYYLKLANVIKAGAPADILAQDSTAVTKAADLYSRHNSLKEFTIDFPSLAPSPQKRPLS